jgi:hypothetical protein
MGGLYRTFPRTVILPNVPQPAIGRKNLLDTRDGMAMPVAPNTPQHCGGPAIFCRPPGEISCARTVVSKAERTGNRR